MVAELFAVHHEDHLHRSLLGDLLETYLEMTRQLLIRRKAVIKKPQARPLRYCGGFAGLPTRTHLGQVALRHFFQIEPSLGGNVRHVPQDISELFSDPVFEDAIRSTVAEVFFILRKERACLTGQSKKWHDDTLLL